MKNDLLYNIDKLHTTELGVQRVKNNLGLDTDNVVMWCRQKIGKADGTVRKGKNWYIDAGDVVITVNSHSYTIITAHRRKT